MLPHEKMIAEMVRERGLKRVDAPFEVVRFGTVSARQFR